MKIQKVGETVKPKRKLDWLVIGGLAIIIIPFLIVGVCKAIDTAVLGGLESSLTNGVAAVKSARESVIASSKACDAAYSALKAYKEEAKLALTGSGSPCGGF